MSSAQVTDGGSAERKTITVGETTEGEPFDVPVEDILTGRAFITGKSGAGKSNTGSVLAEELLERGHPICIVDVDGEYWGLKEEFEILHVGATDECDLQVGAEHAGKLAELALNQHVPIVLDVSGFVDGDEADALVRETARELFAREQQAMQPFLMLVEEVHEFLPQQGGLDETGEMLIRVAKRGRKRGLGIAGLSQRPADVRKDFITQADLLVWHRLTWENDTDVVKRVVGSDHADAVTDLADGEAFVQADWAAADVEQIQFRRKRTFDAGATPGLDDVERPELKSIGDDLVDELEEISDRHQRRQDRVAELEATLEEKDEEIADLEDELESARDLQRLGEAFVDAAQGSDSDAVGDVDRELLEEKNERISDLEATVTDLEASIDERDQAIADLEAEVERLRGAEERVEQAEAIEEQLERARDLLGVDVEQRTAPAEDPDVGHLRERVAELEAENERLRESGESAPNDLGALVQHDAVQAAVDVAKDNCDRADHHVDRVLAVLASSEGGPLSVDEIEPLTEASETTVRQSCKALFESGVVKRESDGRAHTYALDEDFLERRIQVAEQQIGGS